MIVLDGLRLVRVVPREDPPTRSKIGPAALAIIISELGCGETTGQNSGPDIDRYRELGGGRPKDSWCASLVGYCIAKACDVRLGIACPIVPSSRALQLFERCGKAGCFVTEPMPGDVVAWKRKGGGHVGIFNRRLDAGAFESVEGNKGRFPSRVRPYPHEYGEPDFVGFARLP